MTLTGMSQFLQRIPFALEVITTLANVSRSDQDGEWMTANQMKGLKVGGQRLLYTPEELKQEGFLCPVESNALFSPNEVQELQRYQERIRVENDREESSWLGFSTNDTDRVESSWYDSRLSQRFSEAIDAVTEKYGEAFKDLYQVFDYWPSTGPLIRHTNQFVQRRFALEFCQLLYPDENVVDAKFSSWRNPQGHNIFTFGVKTVPGKPTDYSNINSLQLTDDDLSCCRDTKLRVKELVEILYETCGVIAEREGPSHYPLSNDRPALYLIDLALEEWREERAHKKTPIDPTIMDIVYRNLTDRLGFVR
jgi:hypothetical protein